MDLYVTVRRVSVNYHELKEIVWAAIDGAWTGEAGMPDGEQMCTFAEAVMREDAPQIVRARDALGAVAGSDDTAEAAAVIGHLQSGPHWRLCWRADCQGGGRSAK